MKQTMQTGALQKRAEQKTVAKENDGKLSTFLSSPKTVEWITNAISDKKDVQKFISSIVSASTVNVELQSCERMSILSSALLANALNLSLSPQLGLCYIVPFKSKAKYDKEGNLVKPETKEAQFVLGYKGYIQLAIRSGYYKNINVVSIKEGELVSYNPLTEEIEVKIIQDDGLRERAKMIGYYAFLKLTNGFEKAIYWSKEKMMAHADKYSAAFSEEKYKDLQAGKIKENEMWKYSSYWYKDFDGMAYKTMLRQLISKWGIMSIDMQTAYENDILAEQNYLSGNASRQTVAGILQEDEQPTAEEWAEATVIDADGVVTQDSTKNTEE